MLNDDSLTRFQSQHLLSNLMQGLRTWGSVVYIFEMPFDVSVIQTASHERSPDRHIILPKSQSHKQRVTEAWFSSRSLLWDLTPEKPAWNPLQVKESQADSAEGEVRKGITKRIIHKAEYVCPWLPLGCPPLIHLPQLIWFPLMFLRLFDTGGQSYSVCTGKERQL